jgi:hypothetical protein
MKLKSIQPEISYDRKPIVTMAKSKSFVFNKATVLMLNLKGGTSVEFLQDETKPLDWYIRKVSVTDIMKSQNPLGYKLRAPKSKKSSGLHFGSGALYSQFFKSIDFEPTSSYQFLISQDPVVYEGSLCFRILLESRKAVTRVNP